MKRYSDRAEPGMKQATMLYKSPGRSKCKLGTYDYIVVDKCDEVALDLAIEDGWEMSLVKAIDKSGIKAPAKPKPPVTSMPKVPKLPEKKETPPEATVTEPDPNLDENKPIIPSKKLTVPKKPMTASEVIADQKKKAGK